MLASWASSISRRWSMQLRTAMAAAAVSGASKFEKKNTVAEEQDPQLVQVVYVTRHGLRTPLSDSNETICGFPWECLSKEETMKIYEEEIELHRADEGQEHGMSSAQVSRTRLPPGPFEATFSGDKSTALFGKNCAAGQLTLPGHMQMRAVGTKVGYRYKTQLGLLSPEWEEGEIAVRSTNSSRTIETAFEILKGMYPDRVPTKPVRIDLHAVKSETMYPRTSCSFLGSSLKAFRKSQARAQIKAEVAQLFDPEAFESEEMFNYFTRRHLPALCNTLATLEGHGFPLPIGIRREHTEAVCHLSGKEYFELYSADARMTRLGIGSFLGEVVDVLKDKVEYDSMKCRPEQLMDVVKDEHTTPPPKFQLMSGHDNTIAPLIMSLGLTSGTHPPMGSGLAFELYKKQNNQTVEPDFFVQMVYNGQALPFPACNYQFMCPFDQFVSVVTPKTPANYKHECETETPFVYP